MTEPFTKLLASIVSSSIWSEDSDTCKVWVTMLALSNQHGYVGASVPGLARIANVPMEQTQAALALFLAPDEHSRSKEYEGRRIEAVDGGWRLLNHRRVRDAKRGGGPGSNPTTYDKPGKVYFIRCGDSIKIGFSQNPWARLASLKTGTPDEPELLGHVPGTMALERELQDKFAHLRVNREWFRAESELLDYIATVATVATGSSYNTEAEAEAEAEAENGQNIEDPAPERAQAGAEPEPGSTTPATLDADLSESAARAAAFARGFDVQGIGRIYSLVRDDAGHGKYVLSNRHYDVADTALRWALAESPVEPEKATTLSAVAYFKHGGDWEKSAGFPFPAWASDPGKWFAIGEKELAKRRKRSQVDAVPPVPTDAERANTRGEVAKVMDSLKRRRHD